MSTEGRFVLALGLMFLVIWGTNKMFPPLVDESAVPGVGDSVPSVVEGPTLVPEVTAPTTPVGGEQAAPDPDAVAAERRPARTVVVTSPDYRFAFSTRGATLESAELLDYAALNGRDGAVQLLPEAVPALTKSLIVGNDTVSLADLDFEASPVDGLDLAEGGGAETLTFTAAPDNSSLRVVLRYTFRPDDYVVDVTAEVEGVQRPLFVTGLGRGIAYNEADSAQEAQAMAWVGNHLNHGVKATPLRKVDRPEILDGPWRWVAVKSKYFVIAVLPGAETSDDGPYFGGVVTAPDPDGAHPSIAVTQAVESDGSLAYRLYLGPQEYSRLQALGADMEEVNPYGWRWLRPVIRPFVSITLWILNFLHDNLSVGYGWVLVIFGVLMRVLLWPLNQKAMRAQMRNMAVQPLVKEIQAKHKDNPEKLQKEMMRLYKEYGFNPLAGCLPMLLPWPVLIALFFVFRNTIELRGVPFYWLPDLSAKDPLFILPVVLAVSMFALQFISFRSMPEAGKNPQMKMMMYIMPPFFGFIFMNFPSGLNLYYATANLATIPQQILIARERKATATRGPVRVDRSDE